MFLYIDLVGSVDCQRLRDALIFALTFQNGKVRKTTGDWSLGRREVGV